MNHTRLLPTVSDFLGQTWRLTARNFWKGLALGIIGILPAILALIIVLIIASSTGGDATSVGIRIFVPIVVVIGAIGTVYAGARAMIALTHLFYGGHRNHTIHQYLQMDKDKWFGYFCRAVVFRLFVAGGTLLFVIPGIIMGFIFGYTMPAYILDGEKHGSLHAALARSRALTAGARWGIFGRLLLIGLIVLVAGVICGGLIASGSPVIIFIGAALLILVMITGCMAIHAGRAVMYRSLVHARPEAMGRVRNWFIILFVVLGIIYMIVSTSIRANMVRHINELNTAVPVLHDAPIDENGDLNTILDPNYSSNGELPDGEVAPTFGVPQLDSGAVPLPGQDQ